MQQTTPFHFGSAERRLFGLFHAAQATAGAAPGDGAGQGAGERAVLLCSPFGQEAVRGHRIYRVLADRLARAGIATLRFDYHGTGDSSGDDEDSDLDGWVADIGMAHDELRRRSGAGQVVLMGARLGATVAARAAGVGLRGLAKLVLWDPVVDGHAYLALLRVKHVEALEASFSIHDPAWRSNLAHEPSAYTQEAIGFGLSPTMRSQIAALDVNMLSLARLGLTPGDPVHVIAQPGDAAASAWAASLQADGAALTHWPLAHDFDWTTGEAMNTALVPVAAMNRLMASITA